MNICNPLKDKTIIIAEHDCISAESLINTLHDQGFSEVRHASSGKAIFDILRPLHDQPERIGLIVLNEHLPDSQPAELCHSLSNVADGSAIPFILLRTPHPKLSTFPSEQISSLVYQLEAPVDPTALLITIHFLMQLKQERILRYQQEEQLINELASKSVIEAKLKFLVAHDELTGLFNRSSFERQMKLIMNLSSKLKKEY